MISEESTPSASTLDTASPTVPVAAAAQDKTTEASEEGATGVWLAAMPVILFVVDFDPCGNIWMCIVG